MNKHHHITVASYKDENGKKRIGIFAAAKPFSKGGKLALVCAVIGPCVPTLTDAKNTLSGADMEYGYGWQTAARYFAQLCERDAAIEKEIAAAVVKIHADTLDYVELSNGQFVSEEGLDGIYLMTNEGERVRRLADGWTTAENVLVQAIHPDDVCYVPGCAAPHVPGKVVCAAHAARAGILSRIALARANGEHCNADYNIVQSADASPMRDKWDVIHGQRTASGHAAPGAVIIARNLSRIDAIAIADKAQARVAAPGEMLYPATGPSSIGGAA